MFLIFFKEMFVAFAGDPFLVSVICDKSYSFCFKSFDGKKYWYLEIFIVAVLAFVPISFCHYEELLQLRAYIVVEGIYYAEFSERSVASYGKLHYCCSYGAALSGDLVIIDVDEEVAFEGSATAFVTIVGHTIKRLPCMNWTGRR